MFTLIIIVVVVWLIISALTPEKKEKGEIERAIKRTPSVSLNAMQKQPDNIDTFHYENGVVTIKMTNGGKYSGHLKNMVVNFTTEGGYRYNYNPVLKRTVPFYLGPIRKYVSITFNNNNSVRFLRDNAVFSDKDWDRIYNVLECAETIYRI